MDTGAMATELKNCWNKVFSKKQIVKVNVEEVRKREEESIGKVFSSVETLINKSVCSCSSVCGEGSPEEVRACVYKCFQRARTSETAFEKEMTRHKERMQRCPPSCERRVGQSLRYRSKDHQIVAKAWEQCVFNCWDYHLKRLPKIEDRIVSRLEVAAKK